jgi:orotidine-5'-phosphate decarboxylase
MLTNTVYQLLKKNINHLGHCICLGLDPDVHLLSTSFEKNCDGIEAYLKIIIESSHDKVIAYKPNISFFEGLGLEGLHLLEKICDFIPSKTPIILDAKRGDIGNTALFQAKFLFDYFDADAVTVNPYMGIDCVAPFLKYENKLTFVLALTSNLGANNFERQVLKNGKPLFLEVVTQVSDWGRASNNIGFVVGATQAEMKDIRKHTSFPFLIPGVGVQGGTYLNALEGRDENGVAIINASRSLLYNHDEENFNLSFSKKIKDILNY